jgi:hypothetical protein
MKKSSLFRMVLALLIIINIPLLSQQLNKDFKNNKVTTDGVVLSFITVNYYGNNLYIDNVIAGKQYNTDVAVGSINNITPDTSYSLAASYNLSPKVTILNVGRSNAVSFTATLTIPELSYSNTQTVPALNSGSSYEVTFAQIAITPPAVFNFTVQTNLVGDENPINNTLHQYSRIFPGVRRTVLLEEWTSSTCAPCAANNPTIDAFVSARFDSIVAIKHHVWWPAPGNDPMYLYNVPQNQERTNYYGVGGVPHVIMDGKVHPTYPYSTTTSLPDAFYPRKEIATPVTLQVTDTRIAGDSIRASITVNVSSPVKHGDYRLRVSAIERHIHYTTPPGSNNELDFYDVFRKMYPSTQGIALNLTPGVYNYTVTYPIDKIVWVDSMIYTAVYLQDDITKEVLNSAKARHYAEKYIAGTPVDSPPKLSIFNNETPLYKPQELLGSPDRLAGFNFEFFETSFPPAGWRLVNPDNGITFKKFTGANGPSFGGNSAVQMEFYSYSASGRKDTLYTNLYSGLETTDTVKFDWAYAVYTGYADSLVVKLSTNGGQTFPYEIFRKGGAGLATAPATTSSFIPNSSQWLTFAYPLTNVNVPVELTSFTAASDNGSILISWSTATELNNLGFEIERSTDGVNFIKKGFVKGSGTTTEFRSYSFTDKPEFNTDTKLYYRLKQVDFDGNSVYSPVTEVMYEIPFQFSLDQNYPNPFNPATLIRYEIPEQSFVTLKIFNMLGEQVALIVNEMKNPGRYQAEWNAEGFSSGLYIYRIEAGKNVSVRKMLLMK